ncbi:zinc finger protein CONSTANS-LIKE 16-like [Ipomoea triloba]|uniref:zinc finger protein CONSTANS-LIKE 16-like n=1 Tax=Ipomoea triloba TaxID=35885 RepID=UPI00125CF579|nr:zinc finger protein CONSTANS-LIKE 16-like [Ipomoea triloba]
MEGKAAARACDYCIGKRARWYCAADDAFLCQACDSSVHSANPLARRHGRVELKTLSINAAAAAAANIEPSWHRGFTRKPRTPRHGRYNNNNNNNNNNSKPKTTDAPSPVVHDVAKTPLHLSIVPVPEMCSDENYSHDDEKEDNLLLYRVPIFDPFMTDICTTLNSSNITDDAAFNESKCAGGGHRKTSTATTMPPTTEMEMEMEMELAEFAADVESLLGKGLDDEEESFDMEGLGFLGGNGKNVLVVEEKASTMMEFSRRHEKVVVKVEGGEEEDAPACVAEADDDIFMAANANHHYTSSSSSLCFDTLELKFDYDNDYSPNNEKEQVSTGLDKEIKKTILLNLDYEGVILAWSDQRCPWTTGQRPELNSHHGWPDCIMQRGCGSGTIHAAAYDGVGDMGITLGQAAIADDVGREARVSRYREKRRTRLFSKKIRYEVRKLNAEKRPRMKGRFVKRANFPLLDQQIK